MFAVELLLQAVGVIIKWAWVESCTCTPGPAKSCNYDLCDFFQ